MPPGDSHIDALNDAIAGSFDPAWTVHLYTGVDDPTLGPDPTDELTSDGGYAPVAVGTWDASADGVASNDVDFGTSTDAYSDEATVWAIRDGADIKWWDVLPESIDVTAAGTPVVATLEIFPNLAGG